MRYKRVIDYTVKLLGMVEKKYNNYKLKLTDYREKYNIHNH